MSNDYSKHLTEFMAAAEAQGWHVSRTASGHVRFLPPDLLAAHVVIAPGTNSAPRAAEDLRGDLLLSGLVI